MENTANKLRIIFGDWTFGVENDKTHYIFSYAKGGLESLVKNGKEWLYRTPRPTFWRAVTDNDRGSGFGFKSGMWMGADLYMNCNSVEVTVDGNNMGLPQSPFINKFSNIEYAQKVIIKYTYETSTIPSTTVDVCYTVVAGGSLSVTMTYHGKVGLPELPLLGMRFIMPTVAKGFEYEGLSGETYPDRMAGGVHGIYNVEGLPVTPYLRPQDCGVHMDNKWLKIVRNTTLNNSDKSTDDFSLQFEKVNDDFAFSCLPYTAHELENATHIECLPPQRRTVLTMLAKVRGVGGIDSWKTDVEEAYRINAEKDYEFTFTIE